MDRSPLAHILGLAPISWLALLALLWTAAPAIAEPADPSSADVFILDESGKIKASFGVGAANWTADTNQSGVSLVEILSEGGNVMETLGFFTLPGDMVLINEAPNSLASPAPDPDLPPFSIVSFDSALSSLKAPLTPALVISAETMAGPVSEGATVDETLQVTLEAVPGPGMNGSTRGLEIHWTVDGGREQSAASESASFHLMGDGTYAIEAWAVQGGESTTPHEQASYAISGFVATLDGDGDGIPDVAETLFGGDPMSFTDVLGLDADDDGAPDFIEVLCGALGSDHTSSSSRPADSDGDGWSDCQEGWRRTDPRDTQLFYPDAPVALSPFGVEKTIAGTVYSDGAHSRVAALLGDARVIRISAGSPDYALAELPTAKELAVLGLVEGDLPPRFQRGEAEAALAAGQLPAMRIPAAELAVLTVARSPSGVFIDPWMVRRVVGAEPDLLPQQVTAALSEAGTVWTSAAEWLSAYEAYLREHLVVGDEAPVSPITGLGLALFEGIVKELGGGGSDVLLGGDRRFKLAENDAPFPAYIIRLRPVLVSNYQTGGSSVGAVVAELDRLVLGTGPGPLDGLLGDFADRVLALYEAAGGPGAATSPLPPSLLRQVANLVQGPDADPRYRYLPLLLYQNGPDALEALSSEAFAAAIDPNANADGDWLTNFDELVEAGADLSNPLLADSDGDGLVDGVDVCPASPADECLALAYEEMDGDGDGVIDAFDNCLDAGNPLQADGDGDGHGDACPKLAWIRRPSSHLRIFAGSTVVFESDPRRAAGLGVEYQWEFGGGIEGSSKADPGRVAFPSPGTHVVTLTATLSSREQSTDTRIVEVQGAGPPPSVDAGGPYAGIEGEPVELLAAVSSPNGAITNAVWSFGDGGGSDTNPTSHVYADGAYTAEVTVTDVINRFATDTARVDVADSEPDVRFRVEPGTTARAPATLRFVDESTAFDGIARVRWDFDDGSAPGVVHELTHVFQQRGIYDVELQAFDGDGSFGSSVQAVAIGSGLQLLADRDGDGMPDAYEPFHGLDLRVDDADRDLDADSFDNGDEYRLARDPESSRDRPAGVRGAAYEALRDDFADDEYADRWSVGLESPLALHRVGEREGALELSLAAPTGESTSTTSLVLFPTATAQASVLSLDLEIIGLGEVCAALIAGEDDGTRVELCSEATSSGRAAQLRIRVGGAPGVHGALVPVAGSGELALRVEKRGDHYSAFAGDLSLGEIKAPGLASGPLRVVLGSTHHGASADDLVARWRGLSLGHDRDADGLSDAEEDLDGNGAVDEGETDPGDADSDDDGLLDGADDCPLLALPHPPGDPMCIPEPGVVLLQITALLVLRTLRGRRRPGR